MILIMGQSKTATLEGLDASGNQEQLTQAASFSNSNEAVLHVAQGGPTEPYTAYLQPLAVGTSRVTVTYGSLSTILDVTVAEPGVVALAINVS